IHIHYTLGNLKRPFLELYYLVQIRHNLRLDTFAELPVSLVLFSLICIDIVERIRHCRLTGQAASSDERALQLGNTGICPHSGIHFQNITSSYSGPLSFLLASDTRAEVFADSFLFWLDTVEMVRVAGHTPVYFSGWALPVYLFCFLSTMRLALTPLSPLLSPLGVVFQDLPFLVLRMALIGIFGFVTPLLYVMKNLLVCLAYIYFNFMTKLRVFNTERMF
uniref:Transmembrane protein 236 n=1 Tax=Sinocyclocheilus rhinocerous TaxID=307959 RepID=A0A673FJW0_9TELE